MQMFSGLTRLPAWLECHWNSPRAQPSLTSYVSLFVYLPPSLPPFQSLPSTSIFLCIHCLSIYQSVCQTVFCICTFVSQALKHKIKKQFLNPNFSFQTPAIPTNQDCGAISVWPAVNAPVSYSLSVSVTHTRVHTHTVTHTHSVLKQSELRVALHLFSL